MKECLYDELSFEIPGAFFMKDSHPDWDGKRRLISLKTCKFYTGLLVKVCKTIQENFYVTPKIQFQIVRPEKNLNLEWNDKYTLRDYQKTIIESCVKRGRAVIEAATGAGKTLCVSKMIQEISTGPFIFYVLSRDLMYQAQKVLEASIKDLTVGIIGDGVCEIKDINVMTIQTASAAYDIKATKDDFDSMEMTKSEFFKYMEENMDHVDQRKEDIKKLIENAAGIYSDEVHHFSAKSCEKIISRSKKAYYKFGGTATAIRADNSYLVIEGLFGRKTAQITASDLIKLGYLLKPKIRFVQLETPRQIVANYPKDYDAHVVNNEERNDCVVAIAKQAVKDKLSTMILIKNIKHGKALQEKLQREIGIEIPFVHGSTKKDLRQQSILDLESGKIKLMVASTICDEGLDVPTLSCLIMASGGKSPTKAKQRVGRVIRVGSPEADVWDFLDVGRWTKKHSKERMKILKEEPEFDINIVKAKSIL